MVSPDGGSHWHTVELQPPASARVVAVGLDGLVVRSTDTGASLTAGIRADRLPVTAVTLDEQGRSVLYSRQGVVPGDPAGVPAK